MNGVQLNANSPLRSLRSACALYKIGQSGSKQKCFTRLVAHQGLCALLQARDLAANARASMGRELLEQAINKAPSQEVQEKKKT